VHKDPEFEALAEEVELEALPYKGRAEEVPEIDGGPGE
jgi:hypothetical protein